MRLLHKLISFLLFLPISVLAQTNYYVAPSGDDTNTGTLVSPWKTVQHACNTAGPGDFIYLRAGTYEKVFMNSTGAVGNFLTLTNYNNEVATIDGGSTGTVTELMVITAKEYIRIEGLNFTNATGNFSKGIFIGDGSDHIEIINNTITNIHFSNNPADIATSSDNVNPLVVYNTNGTDACENILIQGNTISDCRTGYSEALTLNGNVDGFEVLENTVHDITNIGIDLAGGYGVSTVPATDMARNGTVKLNVTYNCVSPYAVSAGLYVDGGHDIILERNTTYQNGRGIEIGCERIGHTTNNIIVRNNWIYNNLEAGLGIGGYDFSNGNTGKVTNSTVSNNSLYNNNTNNLFNGELLVEYTEDCKIENNIFSATNTQDLLVVTRENSLNLSLDYNLYYHDAVGTSAAKVDYEGAVYTGFPAYQVGSGKDANSIFTNPQFLNTATPDLNIPVTSPAINAGNPTFTAGTGELDFDGGARIENARVDIGSDEVFDISLPVEFLHPFRAVLRNEVVLLTWETAMELDADRYEVERSYDGLVWENISTVLAKNTAATYEVTDRNLESSILYYRLKQIDLNDDYTFSNIESVQFNKLGNKIQIFPNPAKNTFYIHSNQAVMQVEILNNFGQVVLQKREEGTTRIDIKNLEKGIYTVIVFHLGGQSVQQLLIL